MSGVGEILKAIGDFGRFQKCLVLLSVIPCLSVAFHQFCQLFMVPFVPHHCDTSWIRAVGPNLTEEEQLNLTLPRGTDGEFEQCSMYSPVDWDLHSIVAYGLNDTEKCINGWVYPSDQPPSLLTEFDLVCDRKDLNDIAQAIYMAGLLLGSMIFGPLSDSYRMDRCLLPAKGSAHFSLLFRHGADDFGWFELWDSQLEAAGNCRICSYICLFLLHWLKPEKEVKSGSFLDLFRKKHLRKVTLIMSCVWFVNSFVYYGLSLNVTNFGLDIYLTQLAFGAVEIPARVGCIFILQRFGRRKTQAVLLVLSGLVCLIITGIPEDQPMATTVLATIGKFAASASFSTSYVYAAELFPTVVRQTGVGLCSMAARVAAILAPLVRLLGQHHRAIPMGIFGSAPVLGGLLCVLLPETCGTDLADGTGDGHPPAEVCENATSSSQNGEVKGKGGGQDNESTKTTYL
ncbi:PREDICTED: solute carrier family 22 member 13 isoform X2 [Pseudopodoces humilis]|uniref:solute carrier family 22 member 13 isoform X2 n=1 Tax=Pseudopodoces humilis TaxID=181119 RepID=UPI0006B70786|nr:PREDICTED: solute carrier family 22 member 13 isoform X2 [Pseudopodoces humilis]